jgi:hypothetical protein
VASLSDVFTQDLEDMPDSMRISGSNSTHQANQGKDIADQQITFGKNKGRTFSELYQNDRQYLVWLAEKSDNQKWAPVAKEFLAQMAAGPAKVVEPSTGEIFDDNDAPPARITDSEV